MGISYWGMKPVEQINQDIKVEILVRSGCTYSERTLKELEYICHINPNTILEIIHTDDPEPCRKSFGGITPSIWVNGKLWYLGSFNDVKFRAKLRALSSQA
jgi:hypothetical protein